MMLEYSLSQLLMKIKVTFAIIYFHKKVHIKINLIHNILKECLYVLNAIYFDIIDVSEGIDVYKTSASKNVIFITVYTS